MTNEDVTPDSLLENLASELFNSVNNVPKVPFLLLAVCPCLVFYQFRQASQFAALATMIMFEPFLIFLATFGVLTS